jgi:DNA repair protein RadC
VLTDERRCSGPRDVADLVRAFVGDPNREHVVAVYLDRQNAFIAVHLVAMGTVDAALVSPAEVFKAALLCNAVSVVLAHTHPSGESAPSEADEYLTQRMALAGDLIGIPLVDHVVIGQPGYASLAEMGHLGEWPGVDSSDGTSRPENKVRRARRKRAKTSAVAGQVVPSG